MTSLYYTRPAYPGQEKNPGSRSKRKDHSQTSETHRDKENSQTGERRRKRRKASGDEGSGQGVSGKERVSAEIATRKGKRKKKKGQHKTKGFGELPLMDIGAPSSIRMTGPMMTVEMVAKPGTT